MKNYITKEQKEIGKTYNKLVSVVVRFKNENKYYEYLPSGKSEMMNTIYMISSAPKSEILSVEIVKEYYTLKNKWIY